MSDTREKTPQELCETIAGLLSQLAAAKAEIELVRDTVQHYQKANYQFSEEIEKFRKLKVDMEYETQRLRAALSDIKDYKHLDSCTEFRRDYCQCTDAIALAALADGEGK